MFRINFVIDLLQIPWDHSGLEFLQSVYLVIEYDGFILLRTCFPATLHDLNTYNESLKDIQYFCLYVLAKLEYLQRLFDTISIILRIFDLVLYSEDTFLLRDMVSSWVRQMNFE